MEYQISENFDNYIINYIISMRDVLLAINNFSKLKSLANNAKIRSSLKFLLIRYYRVFLLIFILIWVGVWFFLALLNSFCLFFFSWVTYQILVQLIKFIELEDLDAARHDVIKPRATLGNESVSAQKKN